MCGPDFQGRACESPVLDLPHGPFSVHSDEMVYFRYRVPVDGAVAALLHVLPDQPAVGGSGASAAALSSQPILFAKRLGENGGRLLSRGPPLPTTYDTLFSDRVAFRARLPTQAVVRRYLSRGDVLYLGVFNYHRSAPRWLVQSRLSRGGGAAAAVVTGAAYPRAPARIRLQVYPCEVRQFVGRPPALAAAPLFGRAPSSPAATNATWAVDGGGGGGDAGVAGVDFGGKRARVLRACPAPLSATRWEARASFLLLPLMLGTFTMLTMVVCVTTWARVFRVHIVRAVHGRFPADEEFLAGGLAGGAGGGGRRAARRDQLTDGEVRAMFPAFAYAKEQAAALGASGDPTCSVCLSSFEEDELLRRLGCGHAYHASCVDVWLRTNATCPRCRKAARIADAAAGGAVAAAQHWLRRAWRAWGAARRAAGGAAPPRAPRDYAPVGV